MSLKYKFFYCSLMLLLFVVSLLVHKIFFIFLILFIFQLILKRENMVLIIGVLLIVVVVIKSNNTHTMNLTYIEGKVIKSNEFSCIVKSQKGNIKIIHNSSFNYNDFVKLQIEEIPLKQNTNDHAFNEKNYLYGQNVFMKGKVKKIHSVEKQESFYHFIENRMSSHAKLQSFQRLFLFGEKTDEIQEEYNIFKDLSLVHLFALSGMHINILFLLLSSILGVFLTKIPKKICIYILLLFYIVSIPIQISFMRAFFMLVFKDIFNQKLNDLDLWSFLFCFSIIYNPFIIYNISFVFSYFMSFMIIILKQIKYKEILLPLSSFPILLYLNYQLPLFSLVGACLFPMFIQSLYISICLSVFFPFLYNIPLFLIDSLQKITTLLYDVEVFLHFSKPTILFVLTYYVIYFSIIYKISFRKKVRTLGIMLMSLMTSFYVYSHYKIYPIITMIDVGQGDCVLIRLPFEQGNILIDTGGHKDYDIATTTLIPYFKSVGIRHIDFIYISHDDLDHSGALKSLQENFDIRRVINNYEKERIVGPLKIEMLKTKEVYFNDNDNSLIIKMMLYENTFLFMGDASIEVEENLMKEFPSLKADVIKVGHHGSKTSTSAKFLDHIEAKVAMIGVKENNIYNHPSLEVVERLKRKKYTLLRTDEDGMFHILIINNYRYIYR